MILPALLATLTVSTRIVHHSIAHAGLQWWWSLGSSSTRSSPFCPTRVPQICPRCKNALSLSSSTWFPTHTEERPRGTVPWQTQISCFSVRAPVSHQVMGTSGHQELLWQHICWEWVHMSVELSGFYDDFAAARSHVWLHVLHNPVISSDIPPGLLFSAALLIFAWLGKKTFYMVLFLIKLCYSRQDPQAQRPEALALLCSS